MVLAIGFVALLILFLYKMFISPRLVIVSLEKASNGILTPDPLPTEAPAQLPRETRQPVHDQASNNVHHDSKSHLTLSLAVFSAVLGFMLSWDFVNNVYAQEWVSQNITEVGLIAFAIVMGTILLPLGMIVLMGFLERDTESSAHHGSE
jgi:hypothetical protein